MAIFTSEEMFYCAVIVLRYYCVTDLAREILELMLCTYIFNVCYVRLVSKVMFTVK